MTEKKHIATKSAKEQYDDVINKIKEQVKRETSVVFDPVTGVQKCFLKGKLIWVKKVRN